MLLLLAPIVYWFFLVFGEAVAKFVESLASLSRQERSSIEEKLLPQEARILLCHTYPF